MPTPTALSSVSSGIPWLRRFVRDKTRYVGVDVGVDHVRVATFGTKHDSQGGADRAAFSWLSQSEFPLPVDPQLPPQPDWVDLVVDCLRDRLPRCVDGELSAAVVALPIPWIHYQTTVEADISTSQSQCDAMFATSIFRSNAHLTKWRVTADKEQYVVAATAESAACRIAEVISEVGYRVQNILPHGIALLQAASPLTSMTPSAVCLLELSGSLVAMQNEYGCGLCRNLPACDLATGERIYLEQIEPWLQEIATEVNATCRYAARLSGGLDAQSPVLICGRAAQIQGVDAAIATMLGRPVATWRYVGRSRPRHHQLGLDAQSVDSSSAVSLSLAYCAIQVTEPAQRGAR